MLSLYPYQQACVDAIKKTEDAGNLIVMATGTGKTITMAEGIRQTTHAEPVLWLAHREELIEQAERVVPRNVHCATIQTVVRRLNQYCSKIHTIVIDEAHHTGAETYRRILSHFKPERVFGLTATPNRADGVGLDFAFQRILFEYSLPQAVNDGYLARPKIRQVRTGLRLDDIKTRMGDYDSKELERLVNTEARNKIVLRMVDEMPKPCMVFAVDVEHSNTLAALIPNAIAISGQTKKKERKQIYNDFLAGKIPCLVNCQLYTEGADFPNMRTVILARPTQSHALYIQMAGRVLRIADEKKEGWIVDLVDGTYRFPACQAPTLIGLDPIHEGTSKGGIELNGDLLDDIPEVLERAYSSFDAIVKSDKIITDWAKRIKVDTRNINFLRRPDGSLYISVPAGALGVRHFTVPPLKLNEPNYLMQQRIDDIYRELCSYHQEVSMLWDKRRTRGWERHAATTNQRDMIAKFNPEWASVRTLTKGQASKLISYIKGRRRR